MAQQTQPQPQPRRPPPQAQQHWTPGWIAVIGGLAAAATAQACAYGFLPVDKVSVVPVAAVGAAVSALAVAAQGGWLRTILHRIVVWLAAGAWTSVALYTGWDMFSFGYRWVWVSLGCGTALLAGLAYPCRTPPAVAGALGEPVGGDRRPENVRTWEGLLRRISRQPITVTWIEPWATPADGLRVHVDLPEGMTVKELADFCDKFAAAPQLRLPQGCAIRAMDGGVQCEAVLDVMLRDCLADEQMLDEGVSPVSIYDPFQIVTSPRGESLDVTLRAQSMVIGGAPDSGKTTLLHRIIFRLARMVDTLIWVVDLNGGGVAEPWVSPWARGLAANPIVDWVADNEAEGAILVAVAAAIAKDRKTSSEATRRKRAANTTVLPVDAALPAIIVLTDEGGEVRQAAGLFGRMVGEGLSRLAQIGRAEAVRLIMSVLRGTSDLLDKNFRAQASIRICLRMNEEGEADHILGVNPGRTRLVHRGSAWLYRQEDYRPILSRTVNVLLSQIERHAIACAHLRPRLDDRARRVAARVTIQDVIGGRDPDPELKALPIMQDVAAGRAYSGRWDRMAERLAGMRGEDTDFDDDENPPPPPPPPPAPPVGGPALAALAASLGRPLLADPPPPDPAATQQPTPGPARELRVDDDAVDAKFRAMTSADAYRQSGTPWATIPDSAVPTAPDREAETPPPSRAARMTTREHILDILDMAYPDGLTSSQIGVQLEQRGAPVARQHRQDILRSLREAGEITQSEDGTYGTVGRA